MIQTRRNQTGRGRFAPDATADATGDAAVHRACLEQAAIARTQAVRLIESAVAGAFGLALGPMRSRQRCIRPVARGRQVAMYLAHVLLGCNYTQVGGAFGRDRTTVRHACALIEDARDDRSFDTGLARLEDALLVRLADNPVVDTLASGRTL